MTIIRTWTEITGTLWEDWEVEPIPGEQLDKLTTNHLSLFDYATTHSTHEWQGHPTSRPVRVALELEDEETTLIAGAFILPNPHVVDSAPLRFTSRQACIAAVEALPEGGANKSRDAGRGYAQAIKDVLDILRGDR